MDSLRADAHELKTDMNRISGQVANLTGSDYESKAIEQSRRMVRERLDMHQAASSSQPNGTHPNSRPTFSCPPSKTDKSPANRQTNW